MFLNLKCYFSFIRKRLRGSIYKTNKQKKSDLKGKENYLNPRVSYKGNPVGAKHGLTWVTLLPPLPAASRRPYSCWKVSVNKTITVFPGINTMSWTLKVSRAAFRAKRGDKQKASKASKTLSNAGWCRVVLNAAHSRGKDRAQGGGCPTWSRPISPPWTFFSGAASVLVSLPAPPHASIHS